MLSCSDEVLPPTSSPGGFSASSFPTPWCCRPGPICPSLLSRPHPHTTVTRAWAQGALAYSPQHLGLGHHRSHPCPGLAAPRAFSWQLSKSKLRPHPDLGTSCLMVWRLHYLWLPVHRGLGLRACRKTGWPAPLPSSLAANGPGMHMPHGGRILGRPALSRCPRDYGKQKAQWHIVERDCKRKKKLFNYL